MEHIQAKTLTVEEIFLHKYLIPKYQRTYTWNADEHCSQLWDDLMGFHASWNPKSNRKYFLGNITVWRKKAAHPWQVIDGQQRLITLSLLMKAFLNKESDNEGLMGCLFVRNKKWKIGTDASFSLRIKSDVREKDDREIENIIRSFDEEKKYNDESLMGQNYEFFVRRVDEWVNSSTSTKRRKKDKEVNDMIGMLLNNIQIIRVEATKLDDAIQIFQTINDRGEGLSDSDIIKAKIIEKMKEKDIDAFIEGWNKLKDHEFLLGIYMYILRAKKGDANTSSQSIRNFFSEHDGLLANWRDIIDVLQKIQDITERKWNMSDDVIKWWEILERYYPGRAGRVSYWSIPLFVFLNKNVTERLPNDDLNVKKSTQKEFEALLLGTMKFLLVKGLVYRSIAKIRSACYNVYAAIENKNKDKKYNNGNYLAIYEDNIIGDEDIDKFKICIEKHKEFKSYVNLLVYAGAALCPGQKAYDFNNRIRNTKMETEHILPNGNKWYRKWKGSIGWDEEEFHEDINKLGNLMPLESWINKAASNKFFEDKKVEYKDSKMQDAKNLSSITSNEWTPRRLSKRDKEIKDRILKFVGA